jgi:hypothetical protein
MKLQARHPPQRNGVVLMVMVPDKARDGISTNPHSKATPIDFAKAGCCPKRYLQMEKRLFRVEKPSSAPKNAPANNVTDISSSSGWYHPSLISDSLDMNLTFILLPVHGDFK